MHHLNESGTLTLEEGENLPLLKKPFVTAVLYLATEQRKEIFGLRNPRARKKYATELLFR